MNAAIERADVLEEAARKIRRELPAAWHTAYQAASLLQEEAETIRAQASRQEAAQTVAGDVCPDCFRLKARSAGDAAKGYCSKWWAIRDKEAAEDCTAFRNKTGYYTHSAPAEGWQLVPKEPTEAMVDAMCDAWEKNAEDVRERCDIDQTIRALHKAMLAAAPKEQS